MQLLKRTPFYAWHVENGATMYEKGGWVRPLCYGDDPIEEHLRVRSIGGIIDAHSMGKITIEGPGAIRVVDTAATANVATLAVGEGQYTCLCADDGGILDDVIVYRTGATSYYLISNTLSRMRVLERLRQFAGDDAWVQDVTSSTAYLAVQGPRSRELLERAGIEGAVHDAALKYFRCGWYRLKGVDLLLARTGYTGELGFELNFPAEFALDLWSHLCLVGAELGIVPVGAQAMMSLRLEKGYRSYGADIDQQINPLEAGLGWVVDWDKPEFAGRGSLVAAKEQGVARRAVCLRAAPDVSLSPGDKLFAADGVVLGDVTSGLFGPSVGAHVGLGYLSTDAVIPSTVYVGNQTGGKVSVSRRPFYDPEGARLHS